MSPWKECTLGDVLELQRGFDLPIQNRKNGTFPIIASTGVNGYHNEYKVKAPGVVIGRSGSIGGGQYVKSDFWPLNTTLWVRDFKGNNPRFCYYLLKSIDFKQFNVGSGVPTLNRNHIHPLKIKTPLNIDAQIRIAETLGALDDKIEHNNLINDNLESIAQAIFKDWFIDFGPVKAKTEGKKPFGMDDKIDSLFPDIFEESEIGQIPKGWKSGKLEDIAEVIGGGTPSTAESSYYCEPSTGISWLSPKDLSGYSWKYISHGATDITELGLKNSSARMLPTGAVLFSSRAPIGYVAIAEKELSTNQGFKSLVPKNDANSEFLYYLAKANVELIESRASGSTFKEISGNGMKELPVILPPKQILEAFKNVASEFSKLQRELRHETNNLTKTRDLLLPKLISGEISLNDV